MCPAYAAVAFVAQRAPEGGQGHCGLPHCGHALPPRHICGGEMLGLHMTDGGGGGGGGVGGVGVGPMPPQPPVGLHLFVLQHVP